MFEVYLDQGVPTKALCKFSQVSCNRAGFRKVHLSQSKTIIKKELLTTKTYQHSIVTDHVGLGFQVLNKSLRKILGW